MEGKNEAIFECCTGLFSNILIYNPCFCRVQHHWLCGDVRLKDKYPPSWYQILSADKRFVLVMNDEAVLDKETGLVWERSPVTESIWDLGDAEQRTYEKVIANRKSWRLPTIEELSSLVDSTQNPALPIGHPFKNIQSGIYHSSTTSGRIGTTTYREWAIDFLMD